MSSVDPISLCARYSAAHKQRAGSVCVSHARAVREYLMRQIECLSDVNNERGEGLDRHDTTARVRCALLMNRERETQDGCSS